MADGMFSMFDPNAYQQQRAQEAQKAAAAYALQTPQQRADVAGYGFGGALAGGVRSLLGIQDKGLMQVQQANEVMKTIDRNDPKQMYDKAYEMREVNPQFSEALWQEAERISGVKAKAAEAASTVGKNEAQTVEALAKAKAAANESGLKNLPPEVQTILLMEQRDPTFDAKAAMAKFLAGKDKAQWSEPFNLQGATVQKNEATGEIRTAVTRPPVTRISVGGGKAGEGKPSKPLPPKLQADEIEDLKLIDASEEQKKTLAPVISALTPEPATKKPLLELGPANNLEYMARNASGNSNTASRAYAQLKEAVDTAVNIKVSAEKGVQTDKDVLRFANAMIAAFGRNDTTATREAITRFNSAVDRVANSTRKIIDSRRKSQNVEPYFGGEALTAAKGNTRKTASGIEYTVEP